MNRLPDSEILSRFKGAGNRAPASAANPPTPQPQAKDNEMKSLMTALAEVKLVASAELTDEQAAAGFRAAYGALVTERDALKTENQKFKDARKTRVTALVELAVTDKLIAEGRKASLIALGEIDEAEVIAQISDLRAAHAAKAPRGAAPARRLGDPAEDPDGKVKEYQEKMSDKDCTAEARGELAMESLKARGLDGLFKKQSAQPARN